MSWLLLWDSLAFFGRHSANCGLGGLLSDRPAIASAVASALLTAFLTSPLLWLLSWAWSEPWSGSWLGCAWRLWTGLSRPKPHRTIPP